MTSWLYRYRWDIITQVFHNEKNVLKFFEALHTRDIKKLPINGNKYFDLYRKSATDSYLINIEDLLQDKGSSTSDKIIYLWLASKREYTRYTLYDETYLRLGACINLDIKKLKYNTLLRINSSKIYFKYE